MCHQETVASKEKREQQELAVLVVICAAGAAGLLKLTMDFRNALRTAKRRPTDDEPTAGA